MKLTVLGPGCWGLTIAWLLNNNFDEICIWGRSQDLSDELKEYKRATKPLTVQLDKKVEITDDLKKAVDDAERLRQFRHGHRVDGGAHAGSFRHHNGHGLC